MSNNSLSNADSNLKPFIITVSARALFNLEESHQFFLNNSLEDFERYEKERENELLEPGPLFGMVNKMLKFNDNLAEGVRPIEILLLSRNTIGTGMRVLNTIQELNMPMIRAVFTGGNSTSNYLKAINADLFLSTNAEEVKKAIESGVPGATVSFSKDSKFEYDPEDTKIRIAFDGDAVLFSDESEMIFIKGGDLDDFHRIESESANRPMEPGPLKGMLDFIHNVQEAYPRGKSPFETALITARSMPAHMRAINTMRHWGVEVDQAMFLGGRNKGPYLAAFKSDFFFDDGMRNITQAMDYGVVAGHVPYGVRNTNVQPGVKFTGDVEDKPRSNKPISGEEVKVEIADEPKKGSSMKVGRR